MKVSYIRKFEYDWRHKLDNFLNLSWFFFLSLAYTIYSIFNSFLQYRTCFIAAIITACAVITTSITTVAATAALCRIIKTVNCLLVAKHPKFSSFLINLRRSKLLTIIIFSAPVQIMVIGPLPLPCLKFHWLALRVTNVFVNDIILQEKHCCAVQQDEQIHDLFP